MYVEKLKKKREQICNNTNNHIYIVTYTPPSHRHPLHAHFISTYTPLHFHLHIHFYVKMYV